MDSIGRDLNQAIQQVLEALEQRNGVSTEALLSRLEGLQKREDPLKEICLEILGGRNGNTPERQWTGCAYKILSLMSRSSVEIAAIARQVGKIRQGPDLPILEDLTRMGAMAGRMLAQSIQTALHPDADSARRIMEEDSSLDRQKEDFATRAISLANEFPENAQPVVPYVLVSRHLERIGDHASHIAEEVAYYLRGQAA
jgi:phosphate transport system protein